MSSPDVLARAQVAFDQGMRDWQERQDYYGSRPGQGVPCGVDPAPDTSGLMSAGLGYSRPPRADAIFEADKPGLIPHVLPVPLAFDDQAPVSVTGDVHGWGSRPSSGVVYAGVGDARPPRRSLFARLTGRGR
jgi:hypothetical protein